MKCFINKIILCTGSFFFIIDTLCQQDLFKSARPQGYAVSCSSCAGSQKGLWGSGLDTLIALEESCCIYTNSAIQALSNETENAFEELFIDLEGYFTALFEQIFLLQDCACCQTMITPNDITTGGYTINNSGYYCLESDVVYTTGPAITINVLYNQVILDLKGHTITRDIFSGTGPAIVVNGFGGSLIIRNGAFSGGYGHILLNNATMTIIEDIRASYTDGGAPSIQLNACSNIILKNIQSRSSGNNAIEVLNQSKNCYFKDILIQGAGNIGLYIGQSNNCLVENVQAFECASGFFVDTSGTPNSAYNISYKDCLAQSNNQVGFYVSANASDGGNVFDISYTGCKAAQNGNFGFAAQAFGLNTGLIRDISCTDCLAIDNGGYGFVFDEPSLIDAMIDVICNRCTSQGNGNTGYYLQAQSAVVKNCTAMNNNGVGIYLGPYANGCQVLENSVSKNAGFGIQDDGVNNLVYANIASNNGAAYSASVPLQLKPTDITGYWINADENSLVIGEYESKINTLLDLEQSCCLETLSSLQEISSSIDTLQSCCNCQVLLSQGNIPFDITQPGIYCLNEDVSFLSGYGIQIFNTGFGQVVLDLNGHTISGNGLGSGTGIIVNGSQQSVIIRNGVLNNCDIAINLSGASNVLLQDIVISNSIHNGLYIENAALITAERINVYTVSDGDGIFVLSSSYVTFDAIKVNNTDSECMHFDNVSDIVVKNSLTYNSIDCGFLVQSLTGPSQNITFIDCQNQRSSPCAGFALISGASFIKNIEYINCSCSNSEPAAGLGFYVDSIGGGEISNILYSACVATSNEVGFYLIQRPGPIHSFVFKNCIALECYAYGFHLNGQDQSLYNCLLENCVATQCQRAGFLTTFGASHIIKNCEATLSVIGFSFEETIKSQVLNCISNKNEASGFQITAKECLIKDCISSCNGENGIYIAGGVNQILSSTVTSNVLYGIYNTDPSSFIWNSASANNGIDYFGVTSVSASNTTPYWANVNP